MRLWSLHPRYLDAAGLVACWRETLLAQKVLEGKTKGYTRHPQLERWRELSDPVAGVGAYLAGLHAEATERGYRFDASRITAPPVGEQGVASEALLSVSDGQLELEAAHLRAKLTARSPERLPFLQEPVAPHPVFVVEPGPVASWERAV